MQLCCHPNEKSNYILLVASTILPTRKPTKFERLRERAASVGKQVEDKWDSLLSAVRPASGPAKRPSTSVGGPVEELDSSCEEIVFDRSGLASVPDCSEANPEDLTVYEDIDEKDMQPPLPPMRPQTSSVVSVPTRPPIEPPTIPLPPIPSDDYEVPVSGCGYISMNGMEFNPQKVSCEDTTRPVPSNEILADSIEDISQYETMETSIPPHTYPYSVVCKTKPSPPITAIHTTAVPDHYDTPAPILPHPFPSELLTPTAIHTPAPILPPHVPPPLPHHPG